MGGNIRSSVKILAKVGVFALVLLVSAAPTMACLMPAATLTAAEQACCKRMADQCGRAGMPSHSCCQRLSGPEDSTFLKASSALLDHIVNVSYDVPPVPGSLALTVVPSIQAQSNFDFQGPPGSPPATISILRI
jgi:hypothetical protein